LPAIQSEKWLALVLALNSKTRLVEKSYGLSDAHQSIAAPSIRVWRDDDLTHAPAGGASWVRSAPNASLAARSKPVPAPLVALAMINSATALIHSA
jgi:hypothetical protein